MNDIVQIDAREVDRILSTLSDTQTVNDILNEGLAAMSEVYYQSIITSLRQKMGSAAETTGINGKYQYPLIGGVRKHPDKANVQYGIHALTDFRLRFFEGGTRPRYTKGHKVTGYADDRHRRLKRTGKGGYRGFITPIHFFADGLRNAQGQAETTIIEAINKAFKERGIELS